MGPQGRRALQRAGYGAWILLGALMAVAAPDPGPAAPEAAEALYGDARSAQSSAPEGVLALRRALDKLGFETRLHAGLGAPDADVLLLLSPSVALEPAEVESLASWVERGGRLVYAPAAAGDEEPVEDPLLLRLRGPEAAAPPGPDDAVGIERPGAGTLVVLADGGASLSNRVLGEGGLSPQLSWLGPVLAGAQRVAFDEARIGQLAGDGMATTLMRSRYRPAVILGLIALGVLLLAASDRRAPAHPEPPAGSRAFGDALDALAELLLRSGREALARRELVAGTRRRLGGLATSAGAAEVLRAAEGAGGPRRLARTAERLRALERELLRSPRGGAGSAPRLGLSSGQERAWFGSRPRPGPT